MPLISHIPRIRRRLLGVGLIVAIPLAVLFVLHAVTTFKRHDYALLIEPWTPRHQELREALSRTVRDLSVGIGPRNLTLHPRGLAAAEKYLVDEFRGLGLSPELAPVPSPDGVSHNVIVRFPPVGAHADGAWLVIGAHYDTVGESPGSDDNATGVAALLALARRLQDPPAGMRRRGVLLAALTNEEQPYFQTEFMGSYALASSLKDRGEAVHMMLSFDALGYYALAPRTQNYPSPFHLVFGDVGDFLAIVGDLRSRAAIGQVLATLRARTHVPVGALSLPPTWEGAAESDQWSFWRLGYRGMTITDTAFYRSPYYHTPGDTPETLDYARFVRLAEALVEGVLDLAKLPAGDTDHAALTTGAALRPKESRQ